MSMNFCPELSKTQFFPVSIVNNKENFYFEEKITENKNTH